MPSKIILKKSSVASKAPVAGDLDFGELAINYTDSKLYFKKADGSIDAFTSSAAAAPVTSVGGYTGDVTATNLLDAIKTVDGAGSGLDADTLDGLSSASFYLASNPNGYTSNLGTVTNVSATSPLVSSLGTTPTISIPAATASVNGYMTAAYASKLDGIAAGATANTGTVTSVSGSGSVNGLSLSGTVTTSGSLTLGGSVSIGIDNITDEARLFNNMGQNHSTQTDFNAISDFGARYVQGGTNGPTGVWNQFYGFTLGLGNDYALSNYASQFYWPRAAQNTDTYIYVRDKEGGTWGSWRKTKAGYADSAGSVDYNNLSNKTGGSGTYTTSGDYRSPIFYDNNDTGYYVDPNSTSRMQQINFNNLYYAPDTNYGFLGSSIYVDTINSGYAGDPLEINYVRGTWAGISHDSLRAPLYYDYNNTAYYVDPDSETYLYGGIWNNGNHHNSSIKNRLLSGENGATTGEVRLQMWCSEPGNTWDWAGFGYNVDNSSNSNAPAFYFGRPNPNFGQAYMRFGTGGQWYFYTSSSSGTRYTNMYLAPNNGVETYGRLTNDSRVDSPIFYDSNDTGYYIDPNSTANNALRMRGGAHFGPNTTWGASLYVGGDGRVGTSATVAVTNGNLHIDAQDGYSLYLNWYNTSNIYTQSNLGVGSSSASYRLHVHGTGYATSDFRAPIFYDSNNTGYYADLNSTTYLYYLQSATTVRADSDRRLKENIVPITGALAKVRLLQGCTYTRNDLADKTKVYMGMIAQDVLPVVPEVVSGSEKGKYSLGYAELVPLLNEAIKEQDLIIQSQEARIKRLESLIEKLI